MTKKMLIDAGHKEETRVAILDNKLLDEFVYESAMRTPLKGNIFLAKITRVEPSLQAAFVNYGGNRHGFLPFSEIHPDYFRIPVADQEEFEAMQREQLEEHDKQEEDEEDSVEENTETADEDSADADTEESAEDDATEDAGSEDEAEEASEDAESEDESASEEGDTEDENEDEDEQKSSGRRGRGRGRYGRGGGRGRGRRSARSRRPENFSDDEAGQEQRFRFNLRRKYKIQEVIKRGQIMLVQISREERGNKGAAVSTYLSMPGRYCVLMPNSPRGGGVSRKISNFGDRRKMKDILGALDIPGGMSVILRTAGMTRTKTEVKRDLSYLMKMWNSVRELTLKSTAPSLVYEEADLIKRAVRDFYTRDVEEIIVAGEDGHKAAKDFMKMMMPSHAKKVALYPANESVPLFHKHDVEKQIAEIGQTEVTLPSGGYLVINPTEALVSIDVNSGRSTKERNIEKTALHTNLEAAEEVARQLRLRDLGGLVVIDFIDMEDRRNNGKVERKMKEALSGDKARVQVGRISSFGLMELSRQRLNASLSEAQFETCPHCEGRGLIRTADSASLLVLRAIESEGIKNRAAQIIVHVPANVALFLLNSKRGVLADIEESFSLQVLIRVDENMPASNHRIEVSRPIEGDDDSDGEASQASDRDEQEDKPKRRRSRGGRGRNRRNKDQDGDDKQVVEITEGEETATIAEEPTAEEDEKPAPKKRGRKPKAKAEDAAEAPAKEVEAEAKAPAQDPKAEDKPEPKKRGRKPKAKVEDASNDDTPSAASEHEIINAPPAKKKKGWWNKLTD